MPRLDQHVGLVQTKLALGRFFTALAWCAVAAAVVALVGVVVWLLTQWRPPYFGWWLLGLGVAALLAAAIWTTLRRPTAHEAAVAIDQKLGLKEKFSTALFARQSSDPFARAAVLDAERTADNVSLHKRFPIPFPRHISMAAAVAVAAFALSFMTPLDLFGRQEALQQAQVEQQQQEEAKRILRDALVQVRSIAQSVEETDQIKQATKELEQLLANPPKDVGRAQRTALKALQDTQDAIKQQIQESQTFAKAQEDRKLFQGMIPPSQETGPVSDARRAMAKGDFTEAINQLKQAVENFDKMDAQQQQQTAQRMQQMARALEQAAQDPKVQQQIQQQLQQAGASQQQAQQMTQLMQQAAQGNQQAAQQLQQQANQLMQQMAANQGLSQQQVQQMQQAMQQAIQQGQAAANSQQQAQQMAQAAQAMAQAMQQAAQAGQNGQNGQNGQQGQQAQAGAQGQQGQQGQGGQQQAGQAMAQAAQQMQQQLQAMQAAANDAQQVQAAQQAAQQAMQQAAANANCPPGCNGEGGNCGHGGNQPGQGGWAAGNPNNQGGGMGGPGQGAGGAGQRQQAPFTVKQEHAPSANQEDGKLLASFLVKDPTGLPGESKERLKNVIAAAQADQTDEVEIERVSRQSREAVKRYFGQLEEDIEQ